MENKKLKELKEIAARFMKFGKTPDAEPEVKTKKEGYETAKLKDSDTAVDYDPNLEVGSPVSVSSGTGSVPAPDGTYELDNGVVFVVVGGLIESVTESGKTDPPAATDPPAKEDMAGDVVTIEMFNDLKATVDALKQAVDAMGSSKEDFAKVPTKAELLAFTVQLESVGKVIEMLSDIPMDTPGFVDPEATDNVDEKFKLAAEMFYKQSLENNA